LKRLSKVLFAATVFTAASLFYMASPAPAATASVAMETTASAGIEHSEVCMVTDRVFGRPQIAVEYEGKTYYGCCAGCVARIKNDRRVRFATDPVTGAEIDKARAYIVEGPGGAALYFESAETAAEFSRLHPGS